jgi:uncharacterized ion transporter superfamily protein YfcC
MAVAISFGSATVAGAFSPFNTFLLGISQPMVGLRLFSGFVFRSVVFAVAIGAWLGYLFWQTPRMRATPAVAEPENQEVTSSLHSPVVTERPYLVLGILIAGIGLVVLGCLTWSWGIKECSATFIAIGVVAGPAGAPRPPRPVAAAASPNCAHPEFSTPK